MGNVNKKYILEFLVFILLIIFYTVFFTGTKKTAFRSDNRSNQ